MARDFREFFRGGVAVVKKLRLGTAVDTDLALAIISLPVIAAIVIFTPHWWFGFIIVLPIGGYLHHYQFFMKNDPNKLRSERHVENLHRIDAVGMGSDKKTLSDSAYEELPPVDGNRIAIKRGAKK